MTRHRTGALVASACLLALLSACSADGDPDATTDPVSAASATPQATDEDITQAVEVRPRDLPAAYGSRNLFGDSGDEVDGQVTLDACGATFPSEGRRTARHQVAYATKGEQSVSTESVAYEPGGADQAMAELRTAIDECPRGFVDSNLRSQPDLKIRYTTLPPEPDWQEDSLAVRVMATTRGGPSFSGALVYQTRGDVLAGVYVFAGPEASPGLAKRIASVISERLDAGVPGAGAPNA